MRVDCGVETELGGDMNQQKRGIGYYSYSQIKNTTTAGRLGAIVIGASWVFGGLFVIARMISVRKAEVHVWGSPDSHAIGFVLGISLIGIGAFVAHVGVIYYSRKLYNRVSRHSQSKRHRMSPDPAPKG